MNIVWIYKEFYTDALSYLIVAGPVHATMMALYYLQLVIISVSLKLFIFEMIFNFYYFFIIQDGTIRENISLRLFLPGLLVCVASAVFFEAAFLKESCDRLTKNRTVKWGEGKFQISRSYLTRGSGGRLHVSTLTKIN